MGSTSGVVVALFLSLCWRVGVVVSGVFFLFADDPEDAVGEDGGVRANCVVTGGLTGGVWGSWVVLGGSFCGCFFGIGLLAADAAPFFFAMAWGGGGRCGVIETFC